MITMVSTGFNSTSHVGPALEFCGEARWGTIRDSSADGIAWERSSPIQWLLCNEMCWFNFELRCLQTLMMWSLFFGERWNPSYLRGLFFSSARGLHSQQYVRRASEPEARIGSSSSEVLTGHISMLSFFSLPQNEYVNFATLRQCNVSVHSYKSSEVANDLEVLLAYLVTVLMERNDRSAHQQGYMSNVSPIFSTNLICLYQSAISIGFLPTLHAAVQAQMLNLAEPTRDAWESRPMVKDKWIVTIKILM